ncbi:InlB B-repeat-containing protein [Cohnella sp. 56]|uniref:InlB B-repeat-containing protein n=1 Tax=Cohnella sp. 56 TaxID=3113722 RepID=UPI0030EAF46A
MVKLKKIFTVVLALAVLINFYSGVAKAQGTATLKISANSMDSTYGEDVTFNVTALDPVIGGTTPSGTITFRDGNQDLTTVGLTTAEPVITTTNCGSSCPLIQWGAYTYRAYSFGDNRIAMNIVTYDASGNIVNQLEKAGARYLSNITMDAVAQTFTFWGQDDMTITVGWGELLSASSSASFKTSALAIGMHAITAAFPGDDAHAASEAMVTVTVHPGYNVTYNGNGSTGGEIPANSRSYNGIKVSVAGNNGNLVKTGYTFAGWNTQADGHGVDYKADAEGVITSDMTLYAKWKKTLEVGTGTESDPYQISTGEELDTVRNYLDSDLYFKLTADIDLSSYSQGWLPIGSSSGRFQGHMDGNGHKITGLTINRPNDNFAGLFGYIGYDASVSNMILENVNITGKQYVGGLVGRIDGGEISNSYVSGSVTGTSASVGGLIGYNYYGTVNDSFAKANVTGSSNNVGGLIGYNYYGTVNNSFAKASVTGSSNNVGGLVGANFGEISYGYAAGNVTGTGTNVGGLIGTNSGTIGYSYAAGSVTGSGAKVGGLIGNNSGTISYSFYDSGTTGQSDTDKGIGRTTAEMKTQSTYADSDWDFTSTWGISPSRNNGYPYLLAIQKYVTYDGNGNTGGNAPTDDKSYAQGETVNVYSNTATLLKTHYTFAGWNTAADGSGTDYASGASFSMGVSDVTLYAKWILSPTFKVTYSGNGSTGGSIPTDSGSYEQGDPVSVSGNNGNLVKTHYTFAGWNTQADGSGTDYASGASFGMGVSDVTLYAKWILTPTFKVAYNGNGSTGGSVPTDSGSYEQGDPVSVSGNNGNLVKTHYTFAGWNTAADGTGTDYAPDASFSMGSSDVTLYAKWTLTPTFKVTYNGNGITGGSVPTDSGSYEQGDPVSVSGNNGNLVKTHYTFAGWNTQADGTGTDYAPDASFRMGSSDVTLYAKWTLTPTFKVTYNGNGSTGGSAPTDSGSYEQGDTVSVSGNNGNLVKTHYTFAGWNTQADGSGTDYASGASFSMGSSDVTLYAKWTLTPTFKVTYNGNGSTGGSVPTDSGSYEQGDTVSVSGNNGNLVKTHYTFAGWNTQADGSGTDYASGASFSMGLSDVTLYAKWTLTPTFKVTYSGNDSTGGSVPTDSGSYEQGDPVSVSGNNGNLVKTHYTFAGWNTQADGSGTDYASGASFSMGSFDVTLYAKWTLTPTFKVTYNGNGSTGGSVPADSGSYEQGDTVSVSGNNGNLVKTHYTFAGWNTAADGTGTDYAPDASFRMGSSDVTLYAKWTLTPTFKVTYSGNGSTGGSVPTDSGSYEQGDTVSVSGNNGNLVKTHYTFAGWNTQADGSGTDYVSGASFRMGSSDVTLYAKWTLTPTFKVTYNGNGSTGGSVPADSGSYEQGDTVSVSGNNGNLVKTHYTFAGWNTAADGTGTDYAPDASFRMGSSDVTLYAKWTLTPTFKVTYNGNGSTGGSVPTDSGSYEQGDPVSVSGNNGNLVKTHYTFAGWNTAADGTGTDYASGASFSMGLSDVTLYAKWLLTPTFKVTYSGNGSTGGSVPTDSGLYEQGDPVSVSGNNGNLVKTHYTFAGWNTAADGSGISYASGMNFFIGTQNVTLYAQWLSANTLLSGLSLDYGTLHFLPYQTNYTVRVENSVSTLNLFLSKGDPNQSLTVTGANYNSVTGNVYGYSASSLFFEHNPIRITVTAQDGSNTTYVITITREGIIGEPMQLDPSVRTLTYSGGLVIKLPDGLVIPEGTILTVQDSNATPSGEVKLARAGQVIEFQLEGMTITQPVQITLGYDDSSDRSKLAVYYYNVSTGKWEYNPSRVTDNGIETTVSHFSTYGVLADTTAPDQVTITSDAKTTNSITLHLAANDDSGVAKYMIYRDGTLIVETAESTYVDTGLSASKQYIYTAKAVDMLGNISNASESMSVATNGDGGSYTPTPPTSDPTFTSTDGHLTLPAGKAGEVSQGDEIKIVIPANATGKELKLTIDKVSDIQTLITNKDILLSPIFEILKSFVENFDKSVTLSFKFDLNSLKGNEKAVVFYYDEVKKEWVKVGGTVSGNNITVEVNHFTKYAVFAVADAAPPTTDGLTEVSFSDIAAHWAEASIKQAVSAGIVKGYPDNTFKPGRTVTRAEFAVMLMNALKPQGDGAALTFTDKEKIGSWAQKSIAQAVYAGIISGYEDGSFRPNAEITRAEMAAMIAKALGLGLTGGTNETPGFVDDKDIPDWAKGAVATIKNLGIIQGKGANQFAPGDKMTRAEAVTVLLKMLEQKSK